MKRQALGWIALSLATCCGLVPAVEATTFLTEADFLAAVVNPTTVSFDQFDVGSPPEGPLQLGDVTVTPTSSVNPLIFGPGPFGFTTNFLSITVQRDINQVVISFPAGTLAAGVKIASPSEFPVTLTSTYAAAPPETVTISSTEEFVFVGFADPSGLQSIRISSEPQVGGIPIVNIGDISYGPGPSLIEVPALSEIGLAALSLMLLLAAWRMLRRPAASP